MTATATPLGAPAGPEPVRFRPDPGSVAAARRHVRRLLLDWAVEDLLDDVLLLVSELATNAVVHAGTAFQVECVHLGDGIRVAVRDAYPARGLPAVLPIADALRPTGRGLALCAALSTAWGVEYTATEKTVWCRLDLPDHAVAGTPAPPAPSTPPVAAATGGTAASGPPAAAPVTTPAATAAGAVAAGVAAGEPPDLGWATFSDADLVRLRLEDLLHHAVHAACDALQGDAAFLLLTADDGDEPWLATSGLQGPLPAAEFGLPTEPATGDQPAVYADLAAAAGAGPLPMLAGTGMRSAAVAALLADGRPIGRLCVASTRPDGFRSADAQRLQRGADRLALALQPRRFVESTRRRHDWLGFLAEASDLLAGTLEPQMTVSMLAQLVVPRLATWCAVRLYDDRGAPELDYAWHADEARIDAVRGLVNRVVLAAAPAPAVVGSLFGGGPAPAALCQDTAVTLPLQARGRVLGAAVLGRAAGHPFEPDALGLADELVRRAALALDNARLYRIHRATSQALQRSLLPAALPEVPGLDVGVAYQAAGEGLDVGGDFYDLFAVGADRWRFTVGDVAGNGPEAAAVTGIARHALRLLGRQGCPPAEAVSQLNRAILDQPDRTRFLTVLHGEISHRPVGGVRIDLVVAGHPLPYLLLPDGPVTQVGTAQPLLGVLDHVGYRTDAVLLAPGETLLCVTDGVVERRRDGRVLGEDDLPALLAELAGKSASAAAAALQRVVIDYAPQPPRDDMAVLVLRAAIT